MKREELISEILGKRFTHLTILSRSINSTIQSRKVKAKCDCGVIKDVSLSSLIAEQSRTCGKCSLRYKLPSNIGETNLSKEIKRRLIKTCYSIFKASKKREKSDFPLDIEELAVLIQRPCVSCKETGSSFITRIYYGNKYTLFFNGLDQINPKQGYHINNVQTICIYCNRMKHNQRPEDMIRRGKGLVKLGKSMIDENNVNL